MNRDLKALIRQSSLSKMVEQALDIIRRYSVAPVTPESYFMSKLRRRINNPDTPQQEVIDALQPFQLSQDVHNEIVGILRNSMDAYNAVRNLVVNHAPVGLDTSSVALDFYFIAKLKSRINNPNIPREEVADMLLPFQLSQDVHSQIYCSFTELTGYLSYSKRSYY